MGAMRTFITREKKETLALETAAELGLTAFRASNLLKGKHPTFQQPALDGAYVAAVRPLLKMIDHFGEVGLKIKDNINPDRAKQVKPTLLAFVVKCRNAYFDVILAHTAGQAKKGQLNEALRRRGVPEYVHSKFTGSGFVLDRSQELLRVLFPQDPSKGLYLTFSEWRDVEFLGKLDSWLLENSGVIWSLVQKDELIRPLCQLEGNISLTDETNPAIARLQKARVPVVPPAKDASSVTNVGAKLRQGWKFPSPSMDSPYGAVTALGVAMLRVYSANLQSVDLIGDYYATIVPGAVSKAALSPTNNLYVQWAAADDPTSVWLGVISGTEVKEDLRRALFRWLRTELRLSEVGAVGKALKASLGLPNSYQPDHPHVVEAMMVSLPKEKSDRTEDEVLEIRGKITAEEKLPVEKFQKQYFPRPKLERKKKGQGLMALTPLQSAGKQLIAQVKSTVSIPLSERVTEWLRSFSEPRLQNAAAKMLSASFDSVFLEDEESDSDQDSEQSEEEEDE
jgi:hypothetical protein